MSNTDPGPGDQRDQGWEPTSDDLARRPGPGLARQADPQVGTAYAVNVRTEGRGRDSSSETILTFRLRRVDPAGHELPPVSVEMRGTTLNGTVADGDLIRLPAPVTGGGLQLRTVQNLTTGMAVTVPGLPGWVGITFLVIFGVIFLAVLGIIILATVGMFSFSSGF